MRRWAKSVLVTAVLAALSGPGAGRVAGEVNFSADLLAERLEIVPRDGSLRYGESDLEMNATGFAVALRRCYSSRNETDGLFGRGWACVFDRRIEKTEAGQWVMRDEWGGAVGFRPRAGSLFISETGRPQWLLVEASTELSRTSESRALLRDHRGLFWSFDKDGRLDGIYNSAMAGLHIERENGRLAGIRDDYSRAIRFRTDDGGHVLEARSSAGDWRRYEYDNGRLARVHGGEGVRAEYAYDAGGRLSAVVLGGSERAEIAYDGEGRVARLGGPSVAARTVTYETRKVPFEARLVEIRDAHSHVMRYRFRDKPLECQVALPGGGSATINYDGRQLPARIELPGDRRLRLEYDDSGNLLRVAAPGDRVYSFGYTALGQLRQWTRSDGASFAIEWSETGQVRAIRGSRPGDARRFGFDVRGRLAWTADGPTSAILFSHNTWGDISSIAVQGGRTSLLLDHDGAGRVGRIAAPSRPSFEIVYGAAGRPIAMADSVGYRLALSRDGQGRVTAIEDSDRHRERFERDGWGRPQLWQRPEAAQTRLACDAEGNLTEVKLPEGNLCRVAYDGRNQATSDTWAGVTCHVEYDEFGRVIERRNGRGETIRFSYDPMGHLYDILQGGRSLGRFQNAPDGRVLRMSGRDRDWRLGFDEAGRPSRVADSSLNVWAEYAFNAAGRVVVLKTSMGDWLHQYDAHGRLIRLVLKGDKPFEVGYVYGDAEARLPEQVLLPGGTTIAYTYDAHGRPESIRGHLPGGQQAFAERYGYDGRGNVARVETGGRRLDYEYDAQNRLVAQRIDGNLFTRLSYGRDGRLLKVEGEEGALEIVYDAEGRPVRTSQARFEYDADGNRTRQRAAKAETTYRYDLFGRLVGTDERAGSARQWFTPNGWPIGRSYRDQSATMFFVGDLPLYGAAADKNRSRLFVPEPLWGRTAATVGGPAGELGFYDARGRLRAVSEVRSESSRPILWGLLGRPPLERGEPFFDLLALAASCPDSNADRLIAQDAATGLLLSPRPLNEGLFPFGGEAEQADVAAWASRAAGVETALVEQLAAACAAGRFAAEEGAMLRYLLRSHRSPGWPDVGGRETFDTLLDGRSFLTPAAIVRAITETVVRDGTGGLPAAAFSRHAAVPARLAGLGRSRVVCPTLSILPPLILESDFVGSTPWRDDPEFTVADDAFHGWMARLVAHAADRSDVQIAEDGALRLLGELLEMSHWTMPVAERRKPDNLPAAAEDFKPSGDQAERIARRDRMLKALYGTP